MSLDVSLILDDVDVYYANITHNLNKMADDAGIYQHLWRPEEIGINTAFQLIEPLTKGLTLMITNRERFEKFNPSNGWGDYDNFMLWILEYILACTKYPHANIEISR